MPVLYIKCSQEAVAMESADARGTSGRAPGDREQSYLSWKVEDEKE